MKLLITIFISTLLVTGCSHLVLVKDCKKVDAEDKFMCRMIKPWE